MSRLIIWVFFTRCSRNRPLDIPGTKNGELADSLTDKINKSKITNLLKLKNQHMKNQRSKIIIQAFCDLVYLTSFVSISFGQNQSGNSSLKTDTSGQFITFTSPYLAIALAKDFSMISYLGTESGGRSRRLLDRSLLRSGLGGTVVCGDQNSFESKTLASLDEIGRAHV
jgi:hypothetical protein